MLVVTAVTIVLSARMQEDEPDVSEYAKGRFRALTDSRGHQCGDLTLDMRMPLLVNGAKLTFLVLSLGRPTRYVGHVLPPPPPPDEAEDKEFLRVMLIVEMEESGLYERRGMGRVEQDCVLHAFDEGPQWREVVLA